MPNAGYVVSGELTVEMKDGKKKVVTQGEVLPETVGSIHRGMSGNSPVTLIVFYAGTKGLPLSKPELGVEQAKRLCAAADKAEGFLLSCSGFGRMPRGDEINARPVIKKPSVLNRSAGGCVMGR